MTILHHGGRLRNAISQFGGDAQDWVDLSTGVSPWHYPIPEIPVSCWNRLPEEEDGLIAAADRYYCGHNALPVSGSQAAIQLLPSVLAAQRGEAGIVLLPKVGYKEHERAWRKQGWQIEYYANAANATNANELNVSIGNGLHSQQQASVRFHSDLCSRDVTDCQNSEAAGNAVSPTLEQLQRCDALVVINPNNPAACLISKALLTTWLDLLKTRGAFLVIDEAFMDMTPEQSLVGRCDDNLVILRSVGKFFGLAGIRAGFVFAPEAIRLALQTLLGPWCLNGPARYVCTQAFADRQWQHLQKERLVVASERLTKLLLQLPGRVVGTGLFQTVYLPDAPIWHKGLCQRQIFTRLTDEQDALRFGLPVDERQWLLLANALTCLMVQEQAHEVCQLRAINHGERKIENRKKSS